MYQMEKEDRFVTLQSIGTIFMQHLAALFVIIHFNTGLLEVQNVKSKDCCS